MKIDTTSLCVGLVTMTFDGLLGVETDEKFQIILLLRSPWASITSRKLSLPCVHSSRLPILHR